MHVTISTMPTITAWLEAVARVFVLASLPLTACGEPLPVRVTSTEAGYGVGKPEGDDIELMDEVAAVLGLEFQYTKKPYGAVTVVLATIAEGESQGITATRRRCNKVVVASRWVFSIAHEMGHALGLSHICDTVAECNAFENNLMIGAHFPGEPWDTELTDEQLDDLERGRRRLTRCR